MICLACLALSFHLALAAQPPAEAQDAATSEQPAEALSLFERRLADLDERFGEIETLRGEFVQLKRTPLLRKPMESSGTVLLRGEQMRWDTQRPVPSTMLVEKDQLKLYYPQEKILEIYRAKGEDVRLLSGSPLPRLESLREYFTFAEHDLAEFGVTEAEERARHIGLRLEPATEALQEHIAHVLVLLDESVPCVRRLVVTDTADEVTDITFKNVRLGVSILDAEMTLNVPEDVRIVYPQGDAREDDDEADADEPDGAAENADAGP